MGLTQFKCEIHIILNLRKVIDRGKFRNIYQLPTAPQYLFNEEARRSHRNLSDNLTFFTGCSYLLGALGGGASSLIAGVKSFEPGDTAKLRANWVLQPSDMGFLEVSVFKTLSFSLSLFQSLSFFSTMARSSFVALVLMAVLVGSALAQSPSQSPSKSPTQAPAPKASAPSPTVRKTPVPAPSPAVVNSPPSPPPASSEAPVSPPSSISTPPAEAPQSGAVLNRVGFAAGSVAVAVFAAVLVF
nr:mitochondrial import inner membrane translocase subunit tim23-2 [Quercus suber]